MKSIRRKLLSAVIATSLTLQPWTSNAEDIDIFTGDSAGTAGVPNVLIVLDNTSNWSRASQKWPGGEQQGQSEVDAIKTVVNSMDFTTTPMNLGLMEFVTSGTGNDNGGYVRFAVKPMAVASNKTALSSVLSTIYGAITTPDEKRNSGEAYGNLLYDAHNYFKGANQSQGGAGTPGALADPEGYTANYSTFKSPLSCGTLCAKNFIIFISNPDASGPTHDDAPATPGNTTNLANLGGNTSQLGLPDFSSSSTPVSTGIGVTSQCYGSAALCTAAGVSSYAPWLATTCADTTTYPNGCSCGTPQANTPDCAAGTARYSVTRNVPAGTVVSSWTTKDCYASVSPGTTAPATFPSKNEISSCPAGTYPYFASKSNASCSPSTKYQYTVECRQTNATSTNLGYTNSCYADASSCSTGDYAAQCTNPATCSCTTPTTTAGITCASGTSRYSVLGNSTLITNTPTGTSTLDTAPYNADEWSRFLYQKGIPFTGCDNQPISTYTIDVYNAQPNATHTSLMMSMAKTGGGKYYNATNKQALVNGLKQIFAEILSVNSTFASAALPVNATNRAQNENQVFIGMFRPDQDQKPRWYGNLKRYKIIKMPDGVSYDLGDKNGDHAINLNTGFISDCAVSEWTTDSPLDPADLTKGYFWANYPDKPDPASKCTSVPAAKVYSDSPDGPTVEKGAVAEVIRKGNNPSTTNDTPSWAVSRTIYTTTDAASTSLASLSASTTLDATQRAWVAGTDTEDEDSDANKTETRSSVHGDVVHSRPVPVNYGGTTGVVIYYGANDGLFRSVDAATGKELWSFIPHEFAQPAFVDRLRANAPLIRYPGTDMTISPTPQPKAYGWDGSVGLAQDLSNTKVWIYPTMRRGGQMLYGLNVTNPSSPGILWKAGCHGGTCTHGDFSNIGQTWSTPNVAPVAGYATEKLAFFGGGYDPCEDADTATPSCSTPKGAAVYVVDAGSGAGGTGSAPLRKFDSANGILRSVAADIALVDVTGDAKADYAYVADTGGSLYRIDMVDYSKNAAGLISYTPRAPASWTVRRIAYANTNASDGRKFLFAPALLPIARAGKVYVAIGSGDREHPLASNYPCNYKSSANQDTCTNAVTNRFYVYVDDLGVTSGSAVDLNDTSAMNDATTDAGCNSTTILPNSSLKGWFMDLNQYGAGEQTVTTALIQGSLIVFSTNRPIPPKAGQCSTALGEARGYWVNLTSGSGAVGVSGICGGDRSGTFVGGGLPPSPVSGIVPVDDKPVSILMGAVQRDGDKSTTPAGQRFSPTPDPRRKRAYWKIKGVD